MHQLVKLLERDEVSSTCWFENVDSIYKHKNKKNRKIEKQKKEKKEKYCSEESTKEKLIMLG